MLTIVDDFMHACIAVAMGLSILSDQVVRVFLELADQRGSPATPRFDIGSESRKRDARWAAEA